MKFSLKLLTTDSEMTKGILDAMLPYVNRVIQKAAAGYENKVKQILKESIESQPEYNALRSGKLRYELGIPDPGMVSSIVDTWVNSVTVKIKSVSVRGNTLVGGFSVYAVQSNYADVLGSSSATITDVNTGSVVPWLEWLLLRGGDILVSNYEVKMGPNPRSRTGGAIMISSTQDYRMPAAYAGTESNNWVYRGIKSIEKDLESELYLSLQRAL